MLSFAHSHGANLKGTAVPLVFPFMLKVHGFSDANANAFNLSMPTDPTDHVAAPPPADSRASPSSRPQRY